MDAGAWLARFAAVDDAWRAAMAARHRAIGERIRADAAPKYKIVAVPTVLEGPSDVALDDEGALGTLPVAARRVGVAALAAGWGARVVRAVAAVPGKGIVESWSVRASRHGDERLAAVWFGPPGKPAFDCAFYFGPERVMERLGAAKSKGRRTVLDAINGVRLP